MKYFGSAVLMVAVSSFLVVLADSPKIIGPLLSSCMTTSAVPILMTSFFVVLSVPAGICPLPDWSAFEAEYSGTLVGPVPDDRSIWSCTGGANLSNTDVWGAPQAGYYGIPNGYGDMPHIWFGTYGGGKYVYGYGIGG
jgi:hypothetical protein